MASDVPKNRRSLIAHQGDVPVVVLVGRPNVGKSTLFNRLCETRRALTSPVAGTTRDWIEGLCRWDGRSFRIIDTGGYSPESNDVLAAVREQVERWVRTADVVVWVTDGHEGMTPADQSFARWLRPQARRVIVAVNKADDNASDALIGEFARAGYGTLVPISGLHGRRVNELLEHLELLAPRSAAPVEPERPDLIRVAIVGRPNVGKSSLTNHLLGADRMIVSPVAGTTRDAIDAHAVWNNREFLWIDTAGLRASKSKASAGLEGLTRIMAERAIDRCDVALLLVDGVEGLTDGDVAVGRLIDERHRACVVAVNKWDAVQDRATASQWFRDHHPTDLPFMSHSPLFFISAQTGHNVPELLASLVKVRDAFHRTYDKDELEAYLWKKIQERPYTHGGQKLIFRGVEPAAAAPPTFVIRTNMEPDDIHFSYRRRLENLLREAYELNGVPIVLRFRRGRQ